MEITYNVGEIKALIKESSNEFKAKLGNGVESGNKTNNGKAYSDAKKRAKDYDGGLSDEMLEKKPKYDKSEDPNKTLMDFQPLNDVTPEMKKRYDAQMHGYTSDAERKNGFEKAADFSDGDNIMKGFKEKHDKDEENRKKVAQSGLQAREMDKKMFDRNSMMEGVKTIRFKKTTFLTEGHMISRIPDEFKNEGQKFIMEDKTGNKYTVEWSDNRANIIGHENKQGMNESLERMRTLFNYRSEDTRSSRMDESEEKFTDVLNKVRNIND